MKISNHQYEIYLLDFYGSLLTERQSEILALYLNDDLSMQEIADELDISKSAVNDAIHHGMESLNNYEQKLHMVKMFNERSEIYQKLKDLDIEEVNQLVNKLIDID